MLKHDKGYHRAQRFRIPLLTAVVCGAIISGAVAQIGSTQAPLKFKTDYLGYAASVSPRATYTDNLNLETTDLEDDSTILSTVFNGSAIFSNRRFTGLVSGDLDLSYVSEGSDFRVNQNIGGASTFTALDNWLYADFAGQTSRQLVGDNARFSANRNAGRNQRANVHSFSVSPYIYHRLANQSAVELRYRFSQVFIDDSGTASSSNVDQFLNDSRTHEVLTSYQSGALFDRLQFTLSAYGNNTVEDGSSIIPRFEYEQGSLTAEAQLALSRSFSLSGAIGYDDVSTQSSVPLFNDDELSGFFWRAGFTARPGRRTQLRLEYGRRYDDDFIDASLVYDISRRFTLRAGAARTFQTRAQSIARRFRSIQQQTLEFADRLRAGEEMSPESVIATANQVGGGRIDAQSVGIGASNDAFASLIGAFDRTTVSLNANYQDTDFGFRQNENIGGSLNVTHALSRKLNAYGNVFYRRTDTDIDLASCVQAPFLFGFDANSPGFDPVMSCNDFAVANGVTNTVGGRVGASYQLYKNLAVFGEYTHTERFSPVPTLEYDENTFTAGLSLDF